jgi:hypothetical protein
MDSRNTFLFDELLYDIEGLLCIVADPVGGLGARLVDVEAGQELSEDGAR